MNKKVLLSALSILIVSSIFLTGCSQKQEPLYPTPTVIPDITVEKTSYLEERFDGQLYTILGEKYKGIYLETYTGEHDAQRAQFIVSKDSGIDWYDFNETEIYDYERYVKFCQDWGLEQKYTDENKHYAIISYGNTWLADINIRLADIKISDKTITVYIDENVNYEKGQKNDDECIGYALIVPVDEEVLYLKTSLIVSLEEYISIYSNQFTVDKPIIYLYPEEATELTIKLGNEKLITHSYPKYIDGWNIIANPNGDLIDLDTGRSLYSLYYESKPVTDIVMTDEGFIVKGEDTIEFLEEKLAILGLNEREAQEFIIYWLPKLEANEYNYIRFASQREIEANMPLDFSVEPDTLIRVWMEFKGLDTPIEINEQELVTPQREGFVVVEWGGTEIR